MLTLTDIKNAVEAYLFGLDMIVGEKVHYYEYFIVDKIHRYFLLCGNADIISGVKFNQPEIINIGTDSFKLVLAKRFATKADLDYAVKTCDKHKEFFGAVYYTYHNSSVSQVQELIKRYDEYFTRVVYEKRGIS